MDVGAPKNSTPDASTRFGEHTGCHGRVETRIRTMSAQIAALTVRVDSLAEALTDLFEEIYRLKNEKDQSHGQEKEDAAGAPPR